MDLPCIVYCVIGPQSLSDGHLLVIPFWVVLLFDRNADGLGPAGVAAEAVVPKWKEDNALFLSNALGIEGEGCKNRFLTGILVATSMSKELVHTSQEVVQTDAAHTYFGKYTLFSTYTTTANANMVNLAFGLLFRNEDSRNWNHFWKFVHEVHPSVNAPHYTFLTDQDKGSINAVRGNLPQAFNFHCLYNHRQNIIKTCVGAAKLLMHACGHLICYQGATASNGWRL